MKSRECPFAMNGMTVLVTGASSGIGRSCAIEMSRLGASVVLVARREDALRDTARLLAPGTHHVEPLDLTDVGRISEWMREVTARTGPLDALIHSAGVQRTMPLRGVSRDLHREIMTINLDAALFLAQAFRQRNVHRKPSAICLISSIVGLIGQPGLASYSSSKGALIAMARCLALELSSEQIRVNVVAPGLVRTPMADVDATTVPVGTFEAVAAAHPLGVGEPTDVAHAVSYLVGSASRWVTGTVLTVDGGFTAR